MANYMMDTEKQLNRQFSIAIKGYTFEFKTNYKGYVKWGERTKRSMRRRAMELCEAWAYYIAEQAKRRCPHYSGGLEDAIKVSGIRGVYNTEDFGASKMTVSVGVDGKSWQSAYDDVVINLTEKGKLADAQLAGPQLAILLHEQWESIVKKDSQAWKRATRKGDHFGVRVGSGFLTRAQTETDAKLRNMAVEAYRNPLTAWQSKDKYASEALGFNYSDDDEEIPF